MQRFWGAVVVVVVGGGGSALLLTGCAADCWRGWWDRGGIIIAIVVIG